MAHSVCFPAAASSSVAPPPKPSPPLCPTPAGVSRDLISRCRAPRFHSLRVKATTEKDKGTTKRNSIICPDCEGNGAKVCTQCEGSGVNSVDHFNGQFKAGATCWLCKGKREILCGNCNGAGFMGGFMSTFDETSS